VFIEKPGVANHYEWLEMLRDYPNTRFMMVKNNQYRQEIEHFQDLAARSNSVTICWNNYNRIPSPGSWFTDRSKSFGGVSRDLIPHMLSYYCKLVDYNKGNKLYANAVQRWTLDKIDSTDYGLVNSNGIYDVDDFCEMEFVNGKTKFILTANWRNLKENNISICFDLESSAVRYELGLCPESAYKKMIAQAIANLDNESYWLEQKNQDIWIHKQIERL
jgi:predicted dehydrogenase